MAKIKFPSKDKIKEALEEFEYVYCRKMSGLQSIKITNIKYSKREFNKSGDMGIHYTGTLTFDGSKERYDDCNVRLETLINYKYIR